MTYYGGAEMAASFTAVRKNTIQIAEDIPEAQYGFTTANDTRSVAAQLVHIAMSPRFWMQIHEVEKRTTMVGFDFGVMVAMLQTEETRPRSKAEVLELLRTEGDRAAEWLASLPEEFLAERVIGEAGQAPGKTRFENLLGMKEHEMHHRGQLMVLERQLGIVPHLTRQMREFMAKSAQAKAAGA
jgi:uncharacterized damage-inducible protein DinB